MSRFCSQSCAASSPQMTERLRKMSLLPRPSRGGKGRRCKCVHCGVEFFSAEKRRYCSMHVEIGVLAGNAARAAANKSKVTWLAWCRHCGKGFKRRGESERKNQYCSIPCHLASGGAVRAGLASSAAVMRYGAKKDANHQEILDLLDKTHVPYLDTSSMGQGVPDLLVDVHQRLVWWEVKNRKTSYGKRGLNKNQIAWANAWQGSAVYLIYSVDDALRFLNGERDHVKKHGGGKPLCAS